MGVSMKRRYRSLVHGKVCPEVPETTYLYLWSLVSLDLSSYLPGFTVTRVGVSKRGHDLNRKQQWYEIDFIVDSSERLLTTNVSTQSTAYLLILFIILYL